MITIAKSTHLDGILKLWKENRSTLGLMPKDAFIECIKKRWIFVSCDELGRVNGYLQFRHTNRTQTISIVHLCINKNDRGQGVAKHLLDELVKTFEKKVRGIKLSCRSDYHAANKFWSKYNFQPKGIQKSRGNDTRIHLNIWWFNFGRTDLFSSIESDKIKAILDFNIISKLRDIELNTSQHPEVEMLNSDWLTTEIEYYITAETLSEIFRDKTTARSNQSKKFLANFNELNINKNDVNQLERELRSILIGTSENDLSDRRQLAETIISGNKYFLTLDREILSKKEHLENKYNLTVLSPTTFSFEIDELKNSANYYPSKLSASNFTINKLSSKENTTLDCFLHTQKENKKKFENKIDIVLNNNGELMIIKENECKISFIGHYKKDDYLIVELLRMTKHHLAQTILMQNIFDLINYAVKNKILYIKINSTYISEPSKRVLEQFGFYKTGDFYIKVVFNNIIKKSIVNNTLSSIVKVIPELKDLIPTTSSDENSYDSWTYYILEKKLWPLKIDCDDIPCFIIPIKPAYARELFDTKAAKQTLFGVTPKLIWNNENVYYRSVLPNIEKVPARIIWYASSDKNSHRQKAIVGTSYLDEIIIGPAKTVYNQYKKYGIFDWNLHITPMTKGNENKEIKVLKFSHSESFSNPVSYRYLKQILANNNQSHNNFVSPVQINSSTFMEIYKQAKGI